MADRSDITPELLRQLLRYEPETGKLFWLHRDTGHAVGAAKGAIAGWNKLHSGNEAFFRKHKLGYMKGTIWDKGFLAHRVAWAVHYGKWPDGHIDHINGDRTDNRIANLRSVTASGNMRNMKLSTRNQSGFMGVSWCKRGRKWKAGLKVNGKSIYLGYFDNPQDAADARIEASKIMGFHPNHGRSH